MGHSVRFHHVVLRVSALLLLSLVLLLGSLSTTFASVVGPNSPSAASGSNWTGATNVTSSNDVRATYSGTAQNNLAITGFGFAIPAGATIDGIVVEVEGSSSGATAADRQYRVAMTKNGSATAGTAKSAQQLDATEGFVASGSPSDLWGTTWTVAQVNAGTFGVLLADNDTTASGSFSIDFVRVTVVYTTAAGWVDNPMLHNSNRFSGTSKWGGSWGIPSSQHGPIVCGTCHQSGTTNIKRVKTTIVSPGSDNWPNGTTSTSVTFTTTDENANPASTGFGDDSGGHGSSVRVCESCHSLNKYHNYDTSEPAQTATDHYNNDDCIQCHQHKTGFMASCAACHKASNTLADSHAAHYNSSLVAVGNFTSIDSSATDYIFQCGNCHNPASTSHNTGDVDGSQAAEISLAVGGSYTQGAAGASSPDSGNGRTYNYTAGTCSSVYCHGNFGGNGNGENPVWEDTAAADCGDCHDVDTTATLAGGSHQTHVKGVQTQALTCDYCHGGTAQNAAGGIDDKQAHVNLQLEVELDAAKNVFTASSTYNGVNSGTIPQGAVGGAYDNCNNVYCHSNVQPDGGTGSPTSYATPTWGAGSVTCNSCHNAGAAQTTGTHTMHFSTYSIGCGECHQNAGDNTVNHADYEVDVTIVPIHGGTYNYNTGSTIAPGDAYTDCSNVYCHSGGRDGTSPYSGDPPTKLPVWGGSLKDSVQTQTCSGCHGYKENYDATMTTGRHTAHIDSASADKRGGSIGCSSCHDATQISGNAIGNYANHANKLTNVKFIYNATTTIWGKVNKDTDGGGTTYSGSLTSAANGATRAAGSTLNASCDNLYCHSIGNLDADQGTVVAAGGQDFKAIAWDTTTTTDCADCHGDGNTKAYPVYTSGVAGSTTANTHVKHVESSGILCSTCHADTTVSATINPTLMTVDFVKRKHIDRRETVVFNSALVGGSASYDGSVTNKTCSTTYCHGGGTPQWGGAALNCNACHRANNTLPNSHGAHFESGTAATDINSGNSSIAGAYIFQCGNCHNATAHAGGEAVTGIRAAEVSLAGSGSYTPDGATAATDAQGFKYTSGTCGTNDCHNDGTGSAPNTATVEWSVDTLDCTGCHNSNVASGSPMSSGVHTAHINNSNHGASKTCQTCHDDTLDASDTAIADKSVHVNQLVNVAILPAVDGGNSAYGGSCDAVYCHSPGQDSDGTPLTAGSYVTATWATASTGDCGTCHAISEGGGLTSGSHGEHLGTAGVNGCGDCHTGAANNGSAYNSAEHVDGGMDVAGTYNAAVSMGDGYGTCSAASCHDDGTGSPAETPRWGTSGGCASCHADDMTNASHGDHLTTTITTAITISCDNCHGNAVKSTTAITDGLGTHLDDNVDVYNSAIGDLGYPAVNPLGANYQTCSATYCHGDTLKYSNEDDADNIQNVDTSPTWGANLSGAGNGCDYCHGYPPVGDTGGGAQHPTSADCSACHFKVEPTNDLSFTDASEHIDGIVQVDGGNACSDCHGSGKYKDPNTNHPDHADHTDVYTFIAGKTLPDGDYGKEAEGWYSVTYDASGNIVAGCGQCHPQAQASHPSGGATEIDLDPAGETILAVNNAKKLNSSPSYSSSKCSNVYCHSDGNGTFTPVGSLPAWGGPAENLTCGDCHGNSPSSDAHGIHVVGIHYADLYDDDGIGLMSSAGASGAAHGDDITSDPINCQTCHNNTVTVESNDSNSTCVTCHDGSPIALQGESAIKVSSSSHLNGAKDVVFSSMATFKSKAQLRDDIESVTEVGTYWDRNTYKDSGGGSFDTGAGAPTFSGGTCFTVACHNGNTATWTDTNVTCLYCHTSVPQ